MVDWCCRGFLVVVVERGDDGWDWGGWWMGWDEMDWMGMGGGLVYAVEEDLWPGQQKSARWVHAVEVLS